MSFLRKRSSRKASRKASRKVARILGVRRLKGRGDYIPESYKNTAKNYGHKAVDYVVDTASSGVDKLIGKLIGSGDYASNQVKANTLMNIAQQVPEMHSNKASNTARICHREYLGDVYTHPTTPGAFNLQSYQLNPGIKSSFPWLANIANTSYQKWRPLGIVYEFRSMSADALNSTNTALGSVIMACNYSSVDPLFTTKQQMENSQWGMSSKPSQSMLFGIECAKNQTPLGEMYVNNGSENTIADPRFDNLGVFQIATAGGQKENVNLGELWVSYDIELIAPVQNKALTNAGMAHYRIDVGTVTPTSLFGSASRIKVFDNYGITLNANTLTIPRSKLDPKGLYCLYYQLRGATTTNVGAIIVVYQGSAKGVDLLQSGGSNQEPYPRGPANNAEMGITAFFSFDPTVAGDVILVFANCIAVPASLVVCDLLVQEVNSAIVA
ncbi:capsid protein [Crucivirus-212]|nr:capsid protein [Crucivirus-212]